MNKWNSKEFNSFDLLFNCFCGKWHYHLQILFTFYNKFIRSFIGAFNIFRWHESYDDDNNKLNKKRNYKINSNTLNANVYKPFVLAKLLLVLAYVLLLRLLSLIFSTFTLLLDVVPLNPVELILLLLLLSLLFWSLLLLLAIVLLVNWHRNGLLFSIWLRKFEKFCILHQFLNAIKWINGFSFTHIQNTLSLFSLVVYSAFSFPMRINSHRWVSGHIEIHEHFQ